ncbi:MAG: YihY family inner membrane protein, partial [Pseudomonadota bacterium]
MRPIFSALERFMGALTELIGFPRYVARRFVADDGMRAASALSYATALAIVPMLAIGLAMFAAFPAFDDVRVQIILFIFENLSPTLGPQVQGVIEGFLSNARGLTGFGAVGLAMTAVLLLNNIQKVFSKIWREEKPASLLRRLPIYWVAITLGPLLVGASLSLSSQAPALLGNVETLAPPGFAERFGAVALTFVGFFLLFWLMPQSRVAIRDAAFGALFSALAFEAARQGFGVYVRAFPSYEAIYGALAALPVTLIWIYLSWTVI